MYIKMYITHDQLLSGNLRILESCAIWKKKKIHVTYSIFFSWKRILFHKHQLYYTA